MDSARRAERWPTLLTHFDYPNSSPRKSGTIKCRKFFLFWPRTHHCGIRSLNRGGKAPSDATPDGPKPTTIRAVLCPPNPASLTPSKSDGHFNAELFASFRELKESDHGGEFYTVHLMRYRKKALYPAGSPQGDRAREAADRYDAAVVPALLRHGSHPIPISDQAGIRAV